MAMTREHPSAGAAWRKLAVLGLALAVLGLPVNQLDTYALLLIVAVVIFCGAVRTRAMPWLAAIAVVCVAVGGQWLLAPPRIDEGHNVFLPGPAGGVLQRGLPADVYRHMANEFDALYPPAVRCAPGSPGCWQGSHPARLFAFSADGIFAPSDLSRAAEAIDFSNPIWLRLGFINQMEYNWSSTAPDVHRGNRDRRFYMGFDRWHLAMPWFETIRLPAAFVGGELCWRGEIMWEGAESRYSLWRGPGCRAIEAADAGRHVFGIAIKPDTLAMQLAPPWRVRLLQMGCLCLTVFGVAAIVLTLVRMAPRRTIVPFVLIGLAVIVIVLNDASFLGGVRPFDGGDDGIFYDNVGRVILQKLLAGDIAGFLEGGEKVFFYGGPGLRYFRAFEHIIFGESYLGYLSLVLLLPFFVLALFRRFLPFDWSLALSIVFIAVPVGVVFGTSFVQYAQWAARGFADPATYILFIAGLLPIVGATAAGPTDRFLPGLGGALLLALAVFMKPIVLPAAAVLLGGAGLAALVQKEWSRLAGLCVGFLPVLSMTLHNWVFGHVFVPLSANATVETIYVMPPSAWLAALGEMVTLHWNGGDLARALHQIPAWLSGPAESFATVPINAAGVLIVVYIVLRGRSFDPWLRLIGGAALAQHAVALVYVASARYHFLSWFLTGLIAAVWLRQTGIPWLARRYPAFCRRVAESSARLQLASTLARLQKVSS